MIMGSQTVESKAIKNTGTKKRQLLVALPEPGLSMTQDAEWCVVQLDDEWRQFRFHDYDELYSVPGLYEKIIYDILGCDSPRTVRGLLEAELKATNATADSLRVLDLGAGNGMVGEELAEAGVRFLVGLDIIDEALTATKRDRPGVYDHYHILDMTALSGADREALADYKCNTLVCVAALGFGDIPPLAFASAYNLITPGGWIAFNIKENFLADADSTGFAGLIKAMVSDGRLEVRRHQRYQHRLATDGRPLYYTAIVGQKHADIQPDMIPD